MDHVNKFLIYADEEIESGQKEKKHKEAGKQDIAPEKERIMK